MNLSDNSMDKSSWTSEDSLSMCDIDFKEEIVQYNTKKQIGLHK